jgi:hypothetical protein
MTETKLYRAVAHVTGETLGTIKHRGFSIADPPRVAYDPEPYGSPKVVNWDELDALRPGLFPGRKRFASDQCLANR